VNESLVGYLEGGIAGEDGAGVAGLVAEGINGTDRDQV